MNDLENCEVREFCIQKSGLNELNFWESVSHISRQSVPLAFLVRFTRYELS